VAVIRSREISLTLFYQAMSQCKALYKDHSETIMGNMDSIVFLGGREASTLKDISENWLGKATISMQTEGRSRGQSESYSQNMQRLGRELMTTSEITTMPGDKCILQLRGLPPFLSPKYDLKKHPNYKYTAEFDKKKNAFRLESLFRHRPLRLKPEDEYTVYEVDGSDTDEEADLLNFDDLDSDEPVLLRVHSECLTGDAFHSRRCDCGDQLERAMAVLAETGRGVILYLRQEGRGIGLLEKVKAYILQESGLDTLDANLALGHQGDAREYAVCQPMLAYLGANSLPRWPMPSGGTW
jgi:GTP cyclohydrolase II